MDALCWRLPEILQWSDYIPKLNNCVQQLWQQHIILEIICLRYNCIVIHKENFLYCITEPCEPSLNVRSCVTKVQPRYNVLKPQLQYIKLQIYCGFSPPAILKFTATNLHQSPHDSVQLCSSGFPWGNGRKIHSVSAPCESKKSTDTKEHTKMMPTWQRQCCPCPINSEPLTPAMDGLLIV